MVLGGGGWMFEKRSMEINLEQQKVISSPLRSRIIFLLAEQPRTAKQVADEMGKSAGSIHYHIQQLYHHGILELVETKENRGIIEKYYQSKATHFYHHENSEKLNHEEEERRVVNISLTEAEKEAFIVELEQLFYKYIKRTVKEAPDRTSYQLDATFKKMKEGKEENH